MEETGRAESALLVPVPAAAAVVDRWRRRLDPAAAWGVPAHVTVLYPFVPPELIDVGLLADLQAVFASAPSFPVNLKAVKWFGTQVVWLAPEPDAPFRKLINLVADRWPDFPPYGGEHPDVTPHLTVGDAAASELLEEAASLVAAELPIRAFVDEVWLMTGTTAPHSWTTKSIFVLGEQQAEPA